MTKKVITPASGSAQTIYYETNDDNTTVKFYAGGRYAKFATTKQSQVQSWVSQALKSPNAAFHPNGSGSYYIITDMGKAIGTKGERLIKVVFDTAGKIWTAYPMK